MGHTISLAANRDLAAKISQPVVFVIWGLVMFVGFNPLRELIKTVSWLFVGWNPLIHMDTMMLRSRSFIFQIIRSRNIPSSHPYHLRYLYKRHLLYQQHAEAYIYIAAKKSNILQRIFRENYILYSYRLINLPWHYSQCSLNMHVIH